MTTHVNCRISEPKYVCFSLSGTIDLCAVERANLCQLTIFYYSADFRTFNKPARTSQLHMHIHIRIETKVCDRYCYSGVAFSAAKGMDIEWCKACDKGLIAPDCVIYLDMPVEEAAQVSQLR